MYISNQKIKEYSRNFDEFSKYNEFFLNNFLSFLSFKKEFEMSDEIKEGDCVTLKNGEIKMTVGKISDILGDVTAVCYWEESGQHKKDSFYIAALKKCDS